MHVIATPVVLFTILSFELVVIMPSRSFETNIQVSNPGYAAPMLTVPYISRWATKIGLLHPSGFLQRL